MQQEYIEKLQKHKRYRGEIGSFSLINLIFFIIFFSEKGTATNNATIKNFKIADIQSITTYFQHTKRDLKAICYKK